MSMKDGRQDGRSLGGLVAVGIIRSAHTRAEDTPIQPAFAEGCAGSIEVHPEYAEALRDIEGFSHIIVLYRFDRAGEPLLVVKPFLEDVEHGVFATRHPRRPNRIGLSVLKLARREGNTLYVENVDILDGTPLLDVKPYVPRFDAPEASRIGWTGKAIEAHGFEDDLAGAVRFHGHMCPGLAIGIRASRVAMERLGSSRAGDEELVAIVENDSCSADAVQWVAGCTFGKGNFFFRDHGKQVFTFALRQSGRAVRIAIRRRDRRRGDPPVEDRDARTRWLLSAPVEDIFDIRDIEIDIPGEATIHEAVTCDRCGEEAMATRIVRRAGRALCIPCSEGSE